MKRTHPSFTTVPACPGMRRLSASVRRDGTARLMRDDPIVSWVSTDDGLVPVCPFDSVDFYRDGDTRRCPTGAGILASAIGIVDATGLIFWRGRTFASVDTWLEAVVDIAVDETEVAAFKTVMGKTGVAA